jgi:hypothetical protein
LLDHGVTPFGRLLSADDDPADVPVQGDEFAFFVPSDPDHGHIGNGVATIRETVLTTAWARRRAWPSRHFGDGTFDFAGPMDYKSWRFSQ